jgi:hypothetical protein
MRRTTALAFGLLVLLQSSLAGPIDDAHRLYEKAVDAYSNDDALKALSLINESLKLVPDNKQAQKLKLVIESALHPADISLEPGTGVTSDSLWTYCQGENTLESDPQFLHAYHSAEGVVQDPSYATMSLSLPPTCTEYEVLFRMKIAETGSIPSGVVLLNGDKPVVSLLTDAFGRTVSASPKTLAHTKVDSQWHEYSIRWREHKVEVTADGQQVGSGYCDGIPNLLQFGGRAGKKGIQTEAYFEWVGLNYNVPSPPK